MFQGKKKRICVIYANCQGGALKFLLGKSRQFSDRYDLHYYVTYEEQSIPDDIIRNCALFIYQPLSAKWEELSTDALIKRLPRSAKTISFSYLTFDIYWPFFVSDPRNVKTEEHPFGRFPLGDSFLLDRLKEGQTFEEAYRNYTDPDIFNKAYEARNVVEEYTKRFRDIEERRDIRMLDFILANYQKERVFETYNHPSGRTYTELANRILRKLGYPPVKSDENEFSYNTHNQIPIHPLVAGALNLRFSCDYDTPYNLWGTAVHHREFCQEYYQYDPQAEAQPAEGKVAFYFIPRTVGTDLIQQIHTARKERDATVYRNIIEFAADQSREEKPTIVGQLPYFTRQLLDDVTMDFTFLREPLKRVVSTYDYVRENPQAPLFQHTTDGIQNFLRVPIIDKSVNNNQVKVFGAYRDLRELSEKLARGEIDQESFNRQINSYILDDPDEAMLRNAKSNLEKLSFFGLYEYYPFSAKVMFGRIGGRTPSSIPNVDVDVNLDAYSEADMKVIDEMNQWDNEFYSFAKDLFLRRHPEAA